MDDLIKIIDEVTRLVRDKDLFAYEIPLGAIGVWCSDAPIDSRFNDSGAQEFDIYYRGKTKSSAIANVKYLKDAIDSLSGSTGTCMLNDGTKFSLKILFTWDYLEKDSEGYFVFANRVRLHV